MLKKGTVYLLNFILFAIIGGNVFYFHFGVFEAIVLVILFLFCIRGIGENYIETWTNFFLKIRRTFLYLDMFIAIAGYNNMPINLYQFFLGMGIILMCLSCYLYVYFYNEDVEKLYTRDNGIQEPGVIPKKKYLYELNLYLGIFYIWFFIVTKVKYFMSSEHAVRAFKFDFFLIDIILLFNLIYIIFDKEYKDKKWRGIVIIILLFVLNVLESII